ncbi:MAG: T9SS type A sorting domain-containing protein, partial [Bacteroidota bacterium]
DTIWFHYEDQVDFTASSQETNFDCEALIAKGDSLYVFTKEWTSMSTSVYRFPNVPGDYSAQRMGSWNVNGLITGATWNDSLQCIVLSGYSPLLQPFIYLLYDFQDNEFFSGNKRKVSLNLPFHQAEGVAFADNYTLLVSNEYLQQSFITINQKIHTFDLYPYLSAPSSEIFAYEEEALLFPNPTSNKVLIPGFKGNYRILDTAGKTCVNGRIARNEHVEVGHLLAGSYILVFEDYKRSFTFIIK